MLLENRYAWRLCIDSEQYTAVYVSNRDSHPTKSRIIFGTDVNLHTGWNRTALISLHKLHFTLVRRNNTEKNQSILPSVYINLLKPASLMTQYNLISYTDSLNLKLHPVIFSIAEWGFLFICTGCVYLYCKHTKYLKNVLPGIRIAIHLMYFIKSTTIKDIKWLHFYFCH